MTTPGPGEAPGQDRPGWLWLGWQLSLTFLSCRAVTHCDGTPLVHTSFWKLPEFHLEEIKKTLFHADTVGPGACLRGGAVQGSEAWPAFAGRGQGLGLETGVDGEGLALPSGDGGNLKAFQQEGAGRQPQDPLDFRRVAGSVP